LDISNTFIHSHFNNYWSTLEFKTPQSMLFQEMRTMFAINIPLEYAKRNWESLQNIIQSKNFKKTFWQTKAYHSSFQSDIFLSRDGKLVRKRIKVLKENESDVRHEVALSCLISERSQLFITFHAWYLEIVDGVEYLNIVMERATTDLHDLLKKNSLSTQRRTKIALQITSALSFLHNNNIVHLDIKPQNIFMIGEDIAKLGDFGTASMDSNKNEKNRIHKPGENYPFPPEWREIVNKEMTKGGRNLYVPLAKQIDIYYLGILFYVLFTDDTSLERQAEFESKEFTIESVEIMALIEQCMCTNPKERPSADSILEYINQHYNILSQASIQQKSKVK